MKFLHIHCMLYNKSHTPTTCTTTNGNQLVHCFRLDFLAYAGQNLITYLEPFKSEWHSIFYGVIVYVFL